MRGWGSCGGRRYEEDRRFQDESGAGALLGRWGARRTRLNSGGIQAVRIRRGRHSIGRCRISKRSEDIAGRTAPEVSRQES